MDKYASDAILAIAELFERKAARLLSLGELTEPQRGKALQFSVSTLATSLKSLLGINPTLEEWHSWLESNSTVLSGIINRDWDHYWAKYVVAIVGYNEHQVIEGFISQNNTPPSDNFDLKALHLLKGSGPIPTLYLQFGIRNEGRAAVPPPEIAHDAWLVETIRRFYSVGHQQKEMPEIVNFIDKNKSVIKRIRSTFATTAPRYLGGGADGAAFDIGDGKILKVFRDISSFKKASRAFDRLHKNPELAKTEAMIYDVGEFVPAEIGRLPTKLYYYIIEQMTPINDTGSSQDVSDIRFEIVTHLRLTDHLRWKPMRDKLKDPAKYAEAIDFIKKSAKQTAEALRHSEKYKLTQIEDNLELSPDWLETFVEEVMMKYFTYRTDLHMGNLGVTRYGQLRYFDPAYGDEGSERLKAPTR